MDAIIRVLSRTSQWHRNMDRATGHPTIATSTASLKATSQRRWHSAALWSWLPPTVLVTGGLGFIGSHVIWRRKRSSCGCISSAPERSMCISCWYEWSDTPHDFFDPENDSRGNRDRRTSTGASTRLHATRRRTSSYLGAHAPVPNRARHTSCNRKRNIQRSFCLAQAKPLVGELSSLRNSLEPYSSSNNRGTTQVAAVWWTLALLVVGRYA